MIDLNDAAVIFGSSGSVILVDRDDYDWLSQFKWTVSRTGPKVGGKFYAKTAIGNNQSVRMHRLILGVPLHDEVLVDHINGVTLDNRRVNLRIADTHLNTWNAAVKSNSESGFRGVSYNKEMGKFYARIRIDGTRKNLGYFDTAQQASEIYEAAHLRRLQGLPLKG